MHSFDIEQIKIALNKDVNNIQSGIYFAHLNVSSSGGNTDYKIIKIAVIK